jgi:ketosteroid isomerase-like protein
METSDATPAEPVVTRGRGETLARRIEMNDLAAQVDAAAEKVVQAFGRHDVDEYFACFADDATFVFYSSPERFESKAAFEAQWRRWETEDGYRVHSCVASARLVQIVTDDVGLVSHSLTTRVSTTAGEEVLEERETMVLRRDPVAGWQCVHEHLSPGA